MEERPTAAELRVMVGELEAAGPLTVGSDDEGREGWTLTPLGAQVARQMSMSSAEDAAALLDALLDAAQPDATP